MKRLSLLPAVCLRSLPGAAAPRWLRPCRPTAFCVLLASLAWVARLPADEVVFLSDQTAGIRLQHQQQWGDFGFDKAAAATGGTGTALQIGQTTYPRGLGHHANGEIEIDLSGRFSRFRTWVGVQWQGGQRGSVIFRVSVDGEVKFQAGPLSDSDPAQPVDVPLAGARQLRLTATDAGDGFGCDMANWAEACLVLDPRVPLFGNSRLRVQRPAPGGGGPRLGSFFGRTSTRCGSSAGPQPSRPPIRATAGGFSLIVHESGPQVAVMDSAGILIACVDRGEEVRWTIPIRNLVRPVRILADACVVQPGQADVELSLGGERLARTLSHGDPVVLATEPVSVGPGAEMVVTTRGVTDPDGSSLLQSAVRRGRSGVSPAPRRCRRLPKRFRRPSCPTRGLRSSRNWSNGIGGCRTGSAPPRERQSWHEAIQATFWLAATA